MKKVFLLLATAVLALTACEKKNPVIPGGGGDDDPSGEGYKEKTFVVNIVLKDGVSNTYDGVEGTMPGDQILDFLGLTAAEFYKGMGTYTGSAYPDPQTSQENNTIMFGMAEANDTENLKWIPSSSNNFGHWFTANGGLCAWGDNAVIFTESRCEWGLEEPEAEVYTDMWKFTVGAFPGRTAAGETYKATEVFFYTDDDDVELYAYVQWNIKIEASEQVTFDVVGTTELTYNSPFYNDYTHTDLVADMGTDAIAAAIGIDYTEAAAYGVNPDGSFTLAPGKNWWFAVDGTVASWGAGAGICINDDAGTNSWAWCMYPDESLGGQSLKGAFAFVNPTTLKAYVVKVTVNVEGIDYLSMDVLVSYELGESIYELSENNIAAIADALGVETLDLSAIGGEIAIKGVNADGSIYEGGYTANNGYWYSSSGNVTNWGSEDFNAYIEYRGEGKFGCGLWGETGDTNTVKLALVVGENTAVLTFNLTVDEAKSFETTEVGVLNKETSQTLAAGYGGGVVEITEAEVAALIEGTPDDWYLLDSEGTMDYTANGGFWFDAEGNVSPYADGSFFIEPSEAFPALNTGIHPGNVTAAGTFATAIRIANPDSGKHVTVNVTITVTE